MRVHGARRPATPDRSSARRGIFLCPALVALVAWGCGGASSLEVTDVSPPSILSALGDSLLLTGEGLDRVERVTLRQGASVQSAQATLVDATALRVEVQPGLFAGRWDVVLDASGGESLHLKAAFEIIEGELQIDIVDVGQGAASYIRAPDGTTLVIDGGRARTRNGVDSIAPVLDARGIRPDYMLISHLDADHLGGIVDYIRGPDGQVCTRDDRPPLLGLFDYTLWLNTCATELCKEYYALRSCHAERIGGHGWKVPEPGWKLRLGPSTDVTVVAINGRLADGSVVPTGSDNSNSIALVVDFGPFRYFTGGDLTGGQRGSCVVGMDSADVETPLSQLVGPVDVLHVSHHGSCTSTNPAFVQTLKPTVALFSVGENNAYGHPAQDVLDRLDAAGAALYLTSPGITSPEAGTPTRLPASAVRRHGDLRVSTRTGESYVVEVLGAAGASRSFVSHAAH